MKQLVREGYTFYINEIVIYEFINTIEYELDQALEKKKTDRVTKLEILRERFPTLLTDLDIHLMETPLKWEKTSRFLEQMKEYAMNIGDVLILETIIQHQISVIITTDKDWSRSMIKTMII